MTDRWIWIPNWDRFQHYKKRHPPWIKTYVDLLGREEYLALTSHRRAVLHGIWLAYATSAPRSPDDAVTMPRRLSADTASLSSRLRLRVTTPDLVSLSDAGFIEVVASTLLSIREQSALAIRAHATETETETEKTEPNRGLDNGPLHDPTLSAYDWDHILKPIPD